MTSCQKASETGGKAVVFHLRRRYFEDASRTAAVLNWPLEPFEVCVTHHQSAPRVRAGERAFDVRAIVRFFFKF